MGESLDYKSGIKENHPSSKKFIFMKKSGTLKENNIEHLYEESQKSSGSRIFGKK